MTDEAEAPTVPAITVEQIRQQLVEVQEMLRVVEARRDALLHMETGLMALLQTMPEAVNPQPQ